MIDVNIKIFLEIREGPVITAKQLCVTPRYAMMISLCKECKATIQCGKDDKMDDATIIKFIMCSKCAYLNKKARFG